MDESASQGKMRPERIARSSKVTAEVIYDCLQSFGGSTAKVWRLAESWFMVEMIDHG